MVRLIAAWAVAALVSYVGLAAGEARAETSVSSKARTKLFTSQTSLLDRRASKQYANSVRLQPPSARNAVSLASVPAYRTS